MEVSALLKEFSSAVERRDGKAFASLFTEDGVYHDVFYGAFKGREKIAEMIDDWFHRTARDFRWEMLRPVSDGRMLYAYYTFSYVSLLPEANGKRVGFDGVSMMRLRTARSPSTARSPMSARPSRHRLRAGAHRQDPRQGRRAPEEAAGVQATHRLKLPRPAIYRKGLSLHPVFALDAWDFHACICTRE